jgi:hypothetical protein
MRDRGLSVALCLLLLIGFCSMAVAASPPETRYKNFYADGWFGTYALREFDKVAPALALTGLSMMRRIGCRGRSGKAGWSKINRRGHERIDYPWLSRGIGLVGVAREVTDKGLIFETVMGGDGKPARYWIKFTDAAAAIHFQGCILPVRAPGAKQISPMADYKNIRGASGSAWPVQEFDKVAPKPGFNWQGPEIKWAEEAGDNGWLTANKPSLIKRGGLLVLFNRTAKRAMVAFVREVLDSTIVFDFVDVPYSRVITARLTMEQLLDANALGGFVFDSVILPERKKR